MVFEVFHIVAMVPMEEFLEDEKGQDARQDQDGDKALVLDGLKGFGDKVEKDVSQEGPYGQAYQDKDEFLKIVGLKGEEKNACNGNKADQQGADQGVDPDMVHIFLLDNSELANETPKVPILFKCGAPKVTSWCDSLAVTWQEYVMRGGNPAGVSLAGAGIWR
jgi:hypothetical protein